MVNKNNFIHELGKTSYYSLKSPFNSLSNIYTLNHVLSFDEMLNMGVDLYANLYEPLKVAETTYDTDWPTYLNDVVLRLDLANDLLDEDRTEDLTSYYVPVSILDKVPDSNVIKVYDLYLSINLGLFKAPSEVSYITSELNDKAASVSGTTDTCRIISAGEVWMRKSAYDTIETQRADDISSLETLTSIIKRQAAENLALKTKYNALEQAFLATSS